MKLRKETKTPSTVASASRTLHGRWYNDACGTAFALELLGERWSLLIVRELMFGGRRFSDLRGGLPGISAKVLTERLDSLEAAKILRRRQLPSPASAQIYELTPWGYMSETAIKELGRWAATSPHHDPTLPLSPASLILSFRAMFDQQRAEALTTTGTVRIGRDHFVVAVADGKLRAEREEVNAPDFVFAAPAASLIAAAVYGKVAFEELDTAGLAITGDRTAARAFVDCFHLPPKIY